MAGLPKWVSDDICRHLDAIRRHFKDPKITLIVRAPSIQDADVILTDDSLPEARAALTRSEEAIGALAEAMI